MTIAHSSLLVGSGELKTALNKCFPEFEAFVVCIDTYDPLEGAFIPRGKGGGGSYSLEKINLGTCEES